MLKLIADVHLMVNTRIGKYERVSSNGKVLLSIMTSKIQYNQNHNILNVVVPMPN